jgi:phenylalanine-4-hydroxylase
MGGAALRPLDLETAARAEYDPTHFQPMLFCADSFDSMCETLRDYLLAQSD